MTTNPSAGEKFAAILRIRMGGRTVYALCKSARSRGVDLSRQTIERVFVSKVGPTYDTILRIAAGLDIPVEDLVREGGDARGRFVPDPPKLKPEPPPTETECTVVRQPKRAPMTLGSIAPPPGAWVRDPASVRAVSRVTGKFDGRRIRIAAGHLDISPQDYLRRLESGQKWCSRCKAWHEREAFELDPSRTDGLRRYCKGSKRG